MQSGLSISHVRGPGLSNSTSGLVICVFSKSWDLPDHISGISGQRKKYDLSIHVYTSRLIDFCGHFKNILNDLSDKFKRMFAITLELCFGVFGRGDKFLTKSRTCLFPLRTWLLSFEQVPGLMVHRKICSGLAMEHKITLIIYNIFLYNGRF